MFLRRFLVLVVLSVALGSSLIFAQEKIEFPQPSQHAVVKQRVGLTDIEVDYSRPNKNKREIFGGLVPWEKVWRTGANAPTKIKFSDAVKLEDKDIPAGEYALYTIPTPNEWTIILSKNLEQGYKPEADVARVTAPAMKLSDRLESFTIGFDNLRADTAEMFLAWDKTAVPVRVKTNSVEKLSQQIEAAIKSGQEQDASFYNSAAGFYYDQNKDLAQAAKWIDKAIEKSPEAYFMFTRKAQIEAKLGHKQEAIAAAEKSNQILEARPERDEAAIRNNRMLIESLR